MKLNWLVMLTLLLPLVGASQTPLYSDYDNDDTTSENGEYTKIITVSLPRQGNYFWFVQDSVDYPMGDGTTQPMDNHFENLYEKFTIWNNNNEIVGKWDNGQWQTISDWAVNPGEVYTFTITYATHQNNWQEAVQQTEANRERRNIVQYDDAIETWLTIRNTDKFTDQQHYHILHDTRDEPIAFTQSNNQLCWMHGEIGQLILVNVTNNDVVMRHNGEVLLRTPNMNLIIPAAEGCLTINTKTATPIMLYDVQTKNEWEYQPDPVETAKPWWIIAMGVSALGFAIVVFVKWRRMLKK